MLAEPSRGFATAPPALAVLAPFIITTKKCPLEFTQNMSRKIHSKRGILEDKIVHQNWPKVSTRIHPQKMSTSIHQFWKKVSKRIYCPRKVSIPLRQVFFLNLKDGFTSVILAILQFWQTMKYSFWKYFADFEHCEIIYVQNTPPRPTLLLLCYEELEDSSSRTIHVT